MHPRKIVQIGPSAYGISLPLDWLDTQKLQVDDSVYVKSHNSFITIYPKNISTSYSKSVTIDFDAISLKIFNKVLISYYLKNVKTINISGENVNDRFEQIKTYIDKLPYIEIISIEDNTISLENRIEFEGTNLDEQISNMSQCICSMYDSLSIDNMHKSFEKIQTLDTSINKIYFLTTKVLNYSIEIEEDFKVATTITYYSKILTQYEKIGDNVKRISRYLIQYSDELSRLNSHPITQLLLELKQFHTMISNYNGSVYTNDYIQLNTINDKKNSLLRELEDSLSKKTGLYELELVISQLIKDILGLYDEILVITIDKHVNH